MTEYNARDEGGRAWWVSVPKCCPSEVLNWAEAGPGAQEPRLRGNRRLGGPSSHSLLCT